MRGLAEDRSIIIKSANKGSCVVVWDRADYFAEAENPFSHGSTYKEVKLGEEELVRLVEQSNGMFKQLLSKKSISSEDYKYFSHVFKKSINLQNMYFLPKIHKRLDNGPGHPIILNCGTPTAKTLEFLNHHVNLWCSQLKHSYVKDTSDFLGKIKELGKVLNSVILVTVVVAGQVYHIKTV